MNSVPLVETDLRAIEGPRQFLGAILSALTLALGRAVGSALVDVAS